MEAFPTWVFCMQFSSQKDAVFLHQANLIWWLSHPESRPFVFATMVAWCGHQFAHASFAHRWLWRSQDRAEAGHTVKTCSCDGFTALYWTRSFGSRIEDAERRRLAAERYSLSTLWVLEEEGKTELWNMNPRSSVCMTSLPHSASATVIYLHLKTPMKHQNLFAIFKKLTCLHDQFFIAILWFCTILVLLENAERLDTFSGWS